MDPTMDPSYLDAAAPTSHLFGTFSPASLEEDFDGMSDDGESLENADSAAGSKRKSRRRLPSTAEKRANHNAIERARRESLNGRFMELARALPTMAANKRPSKNAIVSKSLDFVRNACAREQTLMEENDRLRSELNELRAKLGMKALEAPASPAKSVAAKAAVSVKVEPASPAAVKTTSTPAVAAAAAALARKQSLSASSASSASTPPALAITTSGPFLAHDALTAAAGSFYGHGFMETFAGQPAKLASSPQSTDSTSDTESSLAHTPPSAMSHDSPLFSYDQQSSLEHDLLAACGMQSTFVYPGAVQLAPWAQLPPGVIYGNPSGYPLYA